MGDREKADACTGRNHKLICNLVLALHHIRYRAWNSVLAIIIVSSSGGPQQKKPSVQVHSVDFQNTGPHS